MRTRTAALVAVLTAGSAALALAHDLFLKPGRYFVEENAIVPAMIVNGTFVTSANSIEAARVADLSVVSPAGRTALDTAGWNAAGDTTRFVFTTGAAGTYVMGVATRPGVIEMDARDFNQYLREEGVPDELARRRRAGELARAAREQYSKYAKALVQVGAARSGNFATVLGYPVEFVPLDNPYRMTLGGRFRLRLLADGRPLPAAHLLYGGTTAGGAPITELTARTNAEGVASFRLTSRGVWYVRMVHMLPHAVDSTGLTHVSRWATLTFAVR